MSKLLSEEQIERLFQNHLKDKVGSGTRKDFYDKNKALEASARTAFKYAFTLLMPIIEKQNEVLENHDCSYNFWTKKCHQCETLKETKHVLERLKQ